MIVVTGANGRLGRRIVDGLLERFSPAEVGASVRDPERAADLAARGVRVRGGDFAAPESLVAAFAGADTVMFVSAHGDNDARMMQHANAVGALCDAGVRRVVYTSFIGANGASPFTFTDVHRFTEALLARSGLEVTVLRNNFYSENVAAEVASAVAAGALRWPSDSGSCAYVSRDDVARAAVAVLCDPTPGSAAYHLTGPQALDYDEVAAAVGRVGGGRVVFERVTADSYATQLRQAGVPDWEIEGALSSFEAVADGLHGRVSEDVEMLTGTPAVDFTTALRSALDG